LTTPAVTGAEVRVEVTVALTVTTVSALTGEEGETAMVVDVDVANTVTLWLEVLPVPASLDVAASLLFFTPAVVPVTLTAKVHEPAAAIVPLTSEIVLEPLTAVIVPAPQLPVTVLETTKPLGSVSLRDTPVKEVLELGLLIVNDNEVLVLIRILAAPKLPVTLGGAYTLRIAEAVDPVPPFVEVMAPVVLV